MPLMRKLVKLAIGYAITKAMARHGGPKGLLDSMLNPQAGKRDRASQGTRTSDRKRGGRH